MDLQSSALRAACAGALSAFVAVAARAQAVEEVPFVTTPDNVTMEMLRLADVGARDHVIDLGSGDGRIVIVAAQRFGATGLGVEIDPNLVLRSRRNAELAGVASRVEFREQDLYATDLSRATVVTLYLLPEVNLQLRPTLLKLAPGTRIVSHDWDMGDWHPDRSVTVEAPDKTIGREKLSRLHLWIVPAHVGGTWCARSTRGAAARLQLAQTYQRARGTLSHRGRAAASFDVRIDGVRLRTTDGLRHAIGWTLDGEALRVTQASGRYAAYAGLRFEKQRRNASRCD